MTVPYGYVDPLGNTETRLIVPQGNDIVLTFMVVDPNNNNAVLNLTGATVELVRKATRFLADTDPSAITYTGVVVAPPTNGIATVAIPGTDNATSGVTWYRFDVILSSQRRTAQYGPLEVMAV